MGDSSEVNFGFGFDDIVFSDRVLRLEIIPPSASDGHTHKYLHWFSALDDANYSEFVNEFEVKTLHISCILLAAKSPFFFKLFKKGMIEESQKKIEVTLRIHASEEAALMDMLNFMYDKPLNASSEAELMDVLVAAHKFEVTTCMKHCIQLLLKLPMTTESAIIYLDLPSSVLVGEVVQPLLDAAKKYLAPNYMDFTETQQEALMALPLLMVQAVLGSDGLKVTSEDVIFSFILNWARHHYPKLEERRDILTKHLVRFICFPYMSCAKLKEVVDCSDFEYEQVSKLVINALFLKAEASYPYRANVECSPFPRRVYDLHLIKVVAFEAPKPLCFVYLDLSKKDCAYLFPSHSHSLKSHKFCFGGRHFFLVAYCIEKQHFGLFVKMDGSESVTLDIEFAVIKKPSEEFEIVVTDTITLKDSVSGRGRKDVFGVSWAEFMRDDSKFFIDGILHLRAQLTISNN